MHSFIQYCMPLSIYLPKHLKYFTNIVHVFMQMFIPGRESRFNPLQMVTAKREKKNISLFFFYPILSLVPYTTR